LKNFDLQYSTGVALILNIENFKEKIPDNANQYSCKSGSVIVIECKSGEFIDTEMALLNFANNLVDKNISFRTKKFSMAVDDKIKVFESY